MCANATLSSHGAAPPKNVAKDPCVMTKISAQIHSQETRSWTCITTHGFNKWDESVLNGIWGSTLRHERFVEAPVPP